MIKYGIKLWSSNKKLLEQSIDLFKEKKIDFVEVYTVFNSFKLEKLEILRELPVILHAPHSKHNFNVLQLGELKIKLFNNLVTKMADLLDSKYIILHAGIGQSQEMFKKNINKIYDQIILIENMPKLALSGKICFGYSLKQLEFIKNACGLNICLDLAHAIKSAVSQNIDYREYIELLISKLNPFYFHICGGETSNEKDEHLNLSQGDFDFKWIKKMILRLAEKKNIYLVFEVPKEGGSLKNDTRNIDYFAGI